MVDFGRTLAEANKGGWNIVGLDFGLDLSTPQGKLVANVLMSVAEWEREVIGQRTREGLAVKRAQGVQMGGRAPFRQRLSPASSELAAGATHSGRSLIVSTQPRWRRAMVVTVGTRRR